MRALGVGAVLALARSHISPWEVLWWLLCALVVAVGTVWAARHLWRWWRGTAPRGWPTPAVVLTGSGCGLLVWGLLAGWATLP